MPSNTPWPRVVNTTMVKHLGEQEVAVLRSSRVGAMLESRGRVSVGGYGIDWQVQYKNHVTNAVSGTQQPNFVAQNLWKTATLETRAYQTPDAMVKKEFLQNKGVEALVKVFERAIPRLIASTKQNFGGEYYVDGNASGNESRLHGFDSFVGTPTQTIDVSVASNAGRSLNVADLVAIPTATYAGISTVLGNAGGSYQTAPVVSDQYGLTHWPNGNVDPEYDFFTPLLVNWPSTGFTGGTGTPRTFKTQGFEALRFAIINNQRNQLAEGAVDMVLLDRVLYAQLLLAHDGNQRTLVTEETGLKSFGFKNVITFDGVELSSEYFVPSACGYGFNINCMELMSMQSKIFDAQGPTWDINSQSYKMMIDFYGNLRFDSPRNFFKLAKYKDA